MTLMNRRPIHLGLTLALACSAGCAGDDPDAASSFATEQYAPGAEAELHAGTIATRAGEMNVHYQTIDGKAIVDGDIVVPWTDFVGGGGARSATVKRESVWPSGVVPFVVDSALPRPQRVTDAVAHWNQRTAIHLVPRTNQTDYVKFVDGSGCSSSVGRVGGEQQVTLGSGCSTGNAMHEIGHAIGLWHEQSRSDRDSFVTINYGNIQAGMSSQFDKYDVGLDAGPYDFGSIMHYGSTAFSSNNLPTITRKDGTSITAQRNALSTGDLLGVETLYGTPFQIGRGAAIGQDGRLDAFVKGSDHAIWHVKQTSPSSGWGSWQSLGGSLRSTPTVARNLDGRLEVFAVGWDNQVYHQWQTGNGSWTGWVNLGGQIAGIPVVGRNLDGRLEVFGLGTDHAIWHAWQGAPNGGWTGWASFGGGLVTNPAVGINLDGRLDVFAIGSDSALWHVTQAAPNGGWNGWISLGGGLEAAPAVGRNLDGRLEVFATGTDHRLYHIWQGAPNGGWGGWSGFGVTVLGTPAVGRNADGRLEVIAVDGNTSLGHLWQGSPGGGWSGWASYGGTTSSRLPDVAINQDGRMEVFTAGVNDRVLYHAWQYARSGSWSGWSPFSGISIVPELARWPEIRRKRRRSGAPRGPLRHRRRAGAEAVLAASVHAARVGGAGRVGGAAGDDAAVGLLVRGEIRVDRGRNTRLRDRAGEAALAAARLRAAVAGAVADEALPAGGRAAADAGEAALRADVVGAAGVGDAVTDLALVTAAVVVALLLRRDAAHGVVGPVADVAARAAVGLAAARARGQHLGVRAGGVEHRHRRVGCAGRGVGDRIARAAGGGQQDHREG